MLSEVPEGWSFSSLGSVVDIKIGGTPSRSNKDYWAQGSDGFTWVSIADLKQGVVTRSKELITEAGVSNSNVKLVREGTVLVSFKLTVGRMAIAGVDLYTNEAIAALETHDECIDRQFLYQSLPTYLQGIETEQAVKGKTLNKRMLSGVPLLLPPLPEQKRIAEILSSVDESIQATQSVIDQAERIKRGLMEDLLTGGLGSEAIARGEVPEGWRIVTVGDLCRPRQHPTIPKKSFTSEGFTVYGANGPIGFYCDYTHSKETIAITCRGATCGTVHLVPAESYITGNAMALDDLEESKVDLVFLFYVVVCFGVEKSITGSAQPQITRASLVPLNIALPPLPEQKRIAKILSSVDEFIQSQKQIIEQYQVTKKGLMDDLLTGKVRAV